MKRRKDKPTPVWNYHSPSGNAKRKKTRRTQGVFSGNMETQRGKKLHAQVREKRLGKEREHYRGGRTVKGSRAKDASPRNKNGKEEGDTQSLPSNMASRRIMKNDETSGHLLTTRKEEAWRETRPSANLRELSLKVLTMEGRTSKERHR